MIRVRPTFRIALAAKAVEDSPESSPLGAASVAAALRAAGALAGRVEVALVEAEPEAAPEALAGLIAAEKPAAVGFSIYCWNRAALSSASRLLRSRNPGLVLFAGGPETTADPLGVIAEAGLDFAVVGEGESAAVAAIATLLEGNRGALSSIPGIALAGQGEAPSRAPPEDPAALASPWLSGILDPARYGGALWELTRGCPYRCAYCYESKGEPGIRRLPIERIEAELELFAASGISQVFVLDPTFNADRDRAAKILDLVRERGRGIRWKFEVRAELLDRALARRFAAISCSLQIGLQSANPEVLATIGRNLDRELFRRKIALLDEAGVTFGLDLIYGLPGEDLAGLRASLDYAIALQPNHLDLFPLALLPATELADRAGELGIEADPSPPYLVRSTRELQAPELRMAAALAGACDLFYSRGRAVSWFLQALRPLRLRPSAFFERFVEWLRGGLSFGAELSHRSIEGMQLAFLEERYRAAGLAELLPALGDIIRFNGAWGRAIADGESEDIELSYDPDDVLGPAAMDLRAFARSARPRPSLVSIAPSPVGEAPILRARPRKGSPGPGRRRKLR